MQTLDVLQANWCALAVVAAAPMSADNVTVQRDCVLLLDGLLQLSIRPWGLKTVSHSGFGRALGA